MKKTLIIGSGGAGKSTFSRRLGAALGIEVIHLDRLFWSANWMETPKDEWRKKVEQILPGDSWIMDGNFGGTMEMRMEACDTIIFLDFPRLVCTYRVLKRIALYKKNNRPDMAEGCDEKFDLKFLSWIWNFSKTGKPKIEKLLDKFQNAKTVIRLKSKAEVEKFLSACSALE